MQDSSAAVCATWDRCCSMVVLLWMIRGTRDRLSDLRFIFAFLSLMIVSFLYSDMSLDLKFKIKIQYFANSTL